MPLHLDDTDVEIIKSLLEGWKKIFQTNIKRNHKTAPTVKSRLERLVNVGFIKGVIPMFDFNPIDRNEGD